MTCDIPEGKHYYGQVHSEVNQRNLNDGTILCLRVKIDSKNGKEQDQRVNGTLLLNMGGLITAVLSSLFVSLVLRDASFFVVLPISIVLFPIGGMAWGLVMWNYTEKLYNKQKNISDTPHLNN